ncbi:MAG: TIGR04013 family B12-binding domain/radical SAM domain-containing protein [Planctomycetota bacterium]|nr:TIGR04013 family B12-binding domain/radical SAM domain-containing protein [Planctomycetota bacterium]
MARLVLSYRSPGRYAFNVLVGALAGELAQGGFELTLARTPRDLEAAVRAGVAAGEPTLVVWSFYSPSLAECAQEQRWLRERVPGGWLALAGGVHATAEPLETLREGFDFVAIGEGEATIVAIARELRRARDVQALASALERVRGLAQLVAGRVESAGRGEPVAELDTHAPFDPSRRLFGPIEITRGCIYACKFCQTPFLAKARFRHRSPANIAHWAGEIARAGLRDVRFVSPTSLSYGSPDESVNLAAVEELLARVREALGAHGRMFFGTFPSEVRPEHVTPQALQLLARFVDNDNLVIGGQSGSERVLAASHRGHDVEAIERAVRTCAEHGFKANVDFLLGLPGEEPEDIAATLALVERLTALGAKAHAHTFMPLPGTPFRKAAAGAVDAGTRERLESFEGAGHLFGAWRKQAEIALELEQRRAASADPRAGNAPDARAASAIPQVHAREP